MLGHIIFVTISLVLYVVAAPVPAAVPGALSVSPSTSGPALGPRGKFVFDTLPDGEGEA
ncbi:hypothetical protein CC78DRAFT_582735 [Lojkania enalia]|uniref:Uncharacterized protein n=1 Tax=Lojkania enalia TaxID=147567 RepID=A0A9P4KA38_9PLEO|nr:hypothetical protein CC78DRAFT_582735 [Didymosphaeria enalia]